MANAHKLADGRYECQNCLKKFTKKPGTFIEPKFCTDVCRKEFHFGGGMSRKRLETDVRRWVRDEISQHQNGNGGNHGVSEPIGGRVSPNKKATARK